VSIATMSPVSCQPSGERLQHAGVLGAQIAEHHVRPADREASAVLDAWDRIEAILHQRREPADRARRLAIGVFIASTGAVSVTP
jgi:hypothetical protein